MAVLEGKVENIPSTSRKQDPTNLPRFHSVYFRGQALPPYDDNMSLIDLGSELPWKTDCQNIHGLYRSGAESARNMGCCTHRRCPHLMAAVSLFLSVGASLILVA